MNWTAIVPFKQPGSRKTRLAGRLSETDRTRLSEWMFAHVVEVLRQSPSVAAIAVLGEKRPAGWDGLWLEDQSRGLNAELAAARDALDDCCLLVIHADLPLLTVEDIETLLEAAVSSCALAPDRHGTGTNALALGKSGPFDFCFGDGSLDRHIKAAKGKAHIVRRTGLAFDVDTPGDLDAALAHGFNFG